MKISKEFLEFCCKWYIWSFHWFLHHCWHLTAVKVLPSLLQLALCLGVLSIPICSCAYQWLPSTEQERSRQALYLEPICWRTNKTETVEAQTLCLIYASVHKRKHKTFWDNWYTAWSLDPEYNTAHFKKWFWILKAENFLFFFLAVKSHEGLASPAGRTIWAVREEMMAPISISI